MKITFPERFIRDYCNDGKIEPFVIETQDQYDGFDYVLSQLNENERIIVDAYYRKGILLPAIGNAMGFSAERARQIKARALWKMRSPKYVGYIQYGYRSQRSVDARRKAEIKRKIEADNNAYIEALKDRAHRQYESRYDAPLSELECLSASVVARFSEAGYVTVGDVAQARVYDLACVPYIDVARITRLRKTIADYVSAYPTPERADAFIEKYARVSAPDDAISQPLKWLLARNGINDTAELMLAAPHKLRRISGIGRTKMTAIYKYLDDCWASLPENVNASCGTMNVIGNGFADARERSCANAI